MKRIVHLTSVHPVGDTRIFHRQCLSLHTAGYEVYLVAPHDRSMDLGGVQIRAVPRTASRAARMTGTVWQVYREAKRLDADLYHFHDPELIPAALALHASGKVVIYDVHEDTPATMAYKHYIPHGVRPVLAWLIDGLEQAAARRFSAVIAATPPIRDRFTASARRLELVQNFPPIQDPAVPQSTPYQERRTWAIYLGVVSQARGVFEMVRAMGQLPTGLGARLQLAGPLSPPSLRERVSQLPGWAAVDVHGLVDRAEVMRLLDSVRVGLVLVHPEQNYLVAYPTKLFEYMAAGLPVVASDFPLWRSIVEEAGCGLVTDPLDPAAIANAIEYLLRRPKEAEEMGIRGREAVRRQYQWSTEKGKLLALYQGLLGPDSLLAGDSR